MRRPLKHPHLNPLPQGEEREQLIEVSRWRRMTVACLRAHFSNCARHRPFVPLSFSLPLGEKDAQGQVKGKGLGVGEGRVRIGILRSAP